MAIENSKRVTGDYQTRNLNEDFSHGIQIHSSLPIYIRHQDHF